MPVFVGIQMGPHTMLDEGIEPCLDLIQETAGINTLLVYSHTYHDSLRKPPQMLANDHGVPARDMRKRKLPSVWVKHHEDRFKGTILRHQQVDNTFEYAGRDVLAELAEPCRKRGMKLYARILEGAGRPAIDGIGSFSHVMTRDIYGRPSSPACWNHPDYRAFWAATAEDLFRSYQLDGFQWGAERHGPIMNLFLTGRCPFCFCEHCRKRGRGAGIDVERARQGFEALYTYVQSLLAGKAKTHDGIFTGALRILLRYPEVLAWEYQYRLSREEMEQAIYGAVKGVRPDVPVGWHLSHQQSSYDLIYRAELSYADMAPYSDFLKFIAYHDILGPRVRWWYLERLQKTIMGEVPLQNALEIYYDLFGYDKTAEGKIDEIDKTGFSPEYVYRETKRSVASAAGKTKVYPGIGFDVPWGSDHFPADPEEVYRAVIRAFDAGADGVVASREYEEMRVPNLKAFGRAIREVNAKRP